ncbi:MAG: DUF4252 domain-containing protein [bacterium]|nr:DUF4252 domain-containing protein [bacterium]
MRFRNLALALVLAALCAPAGWAQDAKKPHPGHFPLDELDILSRDELVIEINLKGPLLRLVAAATRGEEPEFADLIGNLEAVRVRVAELEEVDAKEVREGMGRASGWLDDNGWDVIVRTREDDEEVYVYSRDDGDEIAGLAVLVVDAAGGEVVLVNIVGNVDWSQLEKLAEALDIPQLSQTIPRDEKDPDHEEEP